MGFHLAIAVFKCVTSTNRFSSFEKKVHYSVFKVKNATYLYFVTFSSHIVENPKPVLRACRTDQGDAFTYRSQFHISFRSKLRLW